MMLRIGSEFVHSFISLFVHSLKKRINESINPFIRSFVHLFIRFLTNQPINQSTNQRINGSGFTLVELMIAVVILGFGLGVIIRSYASALSLSSASQNYLSAARFAKNKLNELEVLSYEEKGLSETSQSGDAKLSSRNFNWNMRVAEITSPDYLSKELVKANVKLNWSEQGIPKEFNLAMYLFKKKKSVD